jgi:hypothetical protein
VDSVLARVGYQQAAVAVVRDRVRAEQLRFVIVFEKNPRGFVNSLTEGNVLTYSTLGCDGFAASRRICPITAAAIRSKRR